MERIESILFKVLSEFLSPDVLAGEISDPLVQAHASPLRQDLQDRRERKNEGKERQRKSDAWRIMMITIMK